MSVVLGLNFHHADAAACLLVDGRLVGAVAEERLGDRLMMDYRIAMQSTGFLIEIHIDRKT